MTFILPLLNVKLNHWTTRWIIDEIGLLNVHDTIYFIIANPTTRTTKHYPNNQVGGESILQNGQLATISAFQYQTQTSYRKQSLYFNQRL